MWVWMPLCFVSSFILFLLYFWDICIPSALPRPALVSGHAGVVCWQLLWFRAACAFPKVWFLSYQSHRFISSSWGEALMVLWMGSCVASMMRFPLSVHWDIFYPAPGACFLAPGNPLWLVWTCVEDNCSGVCVFVRLLGCCRDRGCRRDHDTGVALVGRKDW